MTQNSPIDPTVDDPDGVVADAAIDPDDAARSHPLAADAPVRPESPTFAEFGVDDRIVKALAEAGIEHTFAIQELTLLIALTGSDLIGQAHRHGQDPRLRGAAAAAAGP